MNGFEKMKLRAEISGNSIREEKIIDAKRMLELENENDPSYSKTFYKWSLDLSVEDYNQIHPRIYARKKTSDRFEQKIQTLYNEKINIGDIFYDSKDSSYWMCTEIFDMNEISWNGKITRCNYILKWQNSNGKILEYPCLVSNRTFTGDNNNVTILPNNQKSILLRCDSNTLELNVDKRMYVDIRNKSPYKIINDIDTTTYNLGNNGMIYFTMEVSLTQKDNNRPDRPDLGICDYFEPLIPVEPTTEYKIEIKPSGKLTVKGNERTFRPSLRNTDDNNLVDIWTAVWDVNYNGLNQSDFDISYSGNNCIIKVVDNDYDTVGKYIILNCKDSENRAENNYKAEIGI